MTVVVAIYAGADGLDSRLFFPSTLGVTTNAWGAGTTVNSIYFDHSGASYGIRYDGHDFVKNPGLDFSDFVTGGELRQYNGVQQVTIGTMVVSPDQFHDGLTVNSAAWMTPDTMLAEVGGGQIKFFGAAGDDKLFGSNFADYFDGALGKDRMTGYGGNDQFLFDAIGKTNADHITDFAHTHDTILIDRSGDPTLFAGVTVRNLVNTFHDITSQAEQTDDRILYNHDTGVLSYDHDGKGGDKAVLFAYLDNHAKLTSSDFDIF